MFVNESFFKQSLDFNPDDSFNPHVNDLYFDENGNLKVDFYNFFNLINS